MMYGYCARKEIPHERCGKIIVATNETELPKLEQLEQRGLANGLRVTRCPREQIAEYEPHVRGLAALFVAETGIVKYRDVVEALALDVGRSGGEVRRGFRVDQIAMRSDSIVVRSRSDEVAGKNLVNCAGLHSDRVARMTGVEPGVAIIPFRGEYYDLIPERRDLCLNLIYPVPDPRFPFLGVHYTRSVDGEVECGPNAVLALKREGYERTSIDERDLSEMVSYLGFWKLIADHWRMGMFELHRSFSKAAFVKALQALIPELRESDVHPGRAGVRAQAVEPDGRLVDDFRIVSAPRVCHVLNAPSPAATASLAIGEYIASSALSSFA
jgi:L-2-hydroxyglutarate oxidase